MKNNNIKKKQAAPLFICLFGFLVLLANACKKDDKKPVINTSTAPLSGPYLYVGGGSQSKGIFWKISLSQTSANVAVDSLPNSNYVTSIVTSGSDVYLAGQTGGYFKNKSFVPVTGASVINHLALSGSDVYSTGTDNTANIAYWNDNTEFNLESTIGRNLFPYQGVATYGISGIAVSGDKTLVTGSLFSENEPFSPSSALSGSFGLLWTNSGLQLLGKGGYPISAVYNSTAGVAVSGSDVYVAGKMPDSTYAGGYWKNSIWNPVNNGAFSPTSIVVSGSDVYITGFNYTRTASSYSQQGVYLKNGTINTLPGAGTVTAIAINGADIYIVGIDSNNNNVVWKNGSIFKTLGSATLQIVNCLAIGN